MSGPNRNTDQDRPPVTRFRQVEGYRLAFPNEYPAVTVEPPQIGSHRVAGFHAFEGMVGSIPQNQILIVLLHRFMPEEYWHFRQGSRKAMVPLGREGLRRLHSRAARVIQKIGLEQLYGQQATEFRFSAAQLDHPVDELGITLFDNRINHFLRGHRRQASHRARAQFVSTEQAPACRFRLPPRGRSGAANSRAPVPRRVQPVCSMRQLAVSGRALRRVLPSVAKRFSVFALNSRSQSPR